MSLEQRKKNTGLYRGTPVVSVSSGPPPPVASPGQPQQQQSAKIPRMNEFLIFVINEATGQPRPAARHCAYKQIFIKMLSVAVCCCCSCRL